VELGMASFLTDCWWMGTLSHGAPLKVYGKRRGRSWRLALASSIRCGGYCSLEIASQGGCVAISKGCECSRLRCVEVGWDDP
jgi:hypothetical protein